MVCQLHAHVLDPTLQARLVAQQRKLQKKLKHALNSSKIHHLSPQTSIDTMTVADKMVNVLDQIAEVSIVMQSRQPICRSANPTLRCVLDLLNTKQT